MNRLKFALQSLTATSLLALPALALGNGFNPGDLVLYSDALQGISSTSGAIMRLDPHTGVATLIADLSVSSQACHAACYEPVRDRVVFIGSLVATPQHVDFYDVDGNGNIQDLNVPVGSYYSLTAGAGGRVYFVDLNGGSGHPSLRYLDAANAMHTVLDSTGTQTFSDPALLSLICMIYDPNTNALFFSVASGSSALCSGAPSSDIGVHRLTLSADGARVVGVDSCAHFSVDAFSASAGINWSHGPNGQLALVVDTNSNAQSPRMLLVDPVSLNISAFASNGAYAGAAATNAGAWSSALGKMVVVDTGNDVFRVFGAGEVGNGTVLASSIAPSTGGASNETMTLLEVPGGACGASVGFYCTAKTSSSGCVPTLSTSGNPSASAGSGFVLSTTHVEANKSGLYFYGLGGASSIPFQGGFLCVKPPTKRCASINSGGSASCSGTLSFDFAAYIASGADPALVAATTVNAQCWFRDPNDPTSGTGLSGGVVFTLCP